MCSCLDTVEREHRQLYGHGCIDFLVLHSSGKQDMHRPRLRYLTGKKGEKKEMKSKLKLYLYLSGSVFAIAQKCPASLTIEFSRKLMEEREDFADDGTGEHAKIAADIEQVRRFLPDKAPGLVEHIEERLSVSSGPWQLI